MNGSLEREPAPALAVHLMPTVPVARVVELARWAERCGARRCWVNDEGLNTRDPYVTLTAIAGATSTMALGPGIANPYTRHPGVTAAAVASLDEVSDGRAFLGLGAGGGLALGPLAVERRSPRRTIEETILTTRALFAGDTVDHDGAVFGYRHARLGYGRADIEILVAGRGALVTETAGRLADGFNLGYIHKDLLADQVATLRALAGERRFVVTYTTMLVTDEAQFAAARAALSFRLVDSPEAVRRRLGITSADLDAIGNALRAGGPSAAAAHVDPEWVPQFMIVGTEAECGRELGELLARHRIDEFQLPVSDPETGAALIERVADSLRTP